MSQWVLSQHPDIDTKCTDVDDPVTHRYIETYHKKETMKAEHTPHRFPAAAGLTEAR
jgi:hypothetical protein